MPKLKRKLRSFAATFVVVGMLIAASGLSAPASARTATSNPTAAQSRGCSVHSDGRLWCGNRSGAKLYYWPTYGSVPTGIMDTSYSWFTCWQYGDWHSGGNNIWYFSQGDRGLNGLHAWGFMPAVDVWTHVDPAPGLQRCPVPMHGR